MLLLNKYYLKQFISSTLIGIVIFAFILFLDKLFAISHLLIVKHIDFITIFKLSIVIFLTILALTIPIGSLLGAVLTFARASEKNEFTAIRAAGVNFLKLLLPFWTLIFLSSLITIIYNFELLPRVNTVYKKMYTDIMLRYPITKLEPKKFIRIGDYCMFISNIGPDNVLEGVIIYKFDNLTLTGHISGKKAKCVNFAQNGVILTLYNGEIHDLNNKNIKSATNVLFFNKYNLSLPLKPPLEKEKVSLSRSLKELTYKELLDKIKFGKDNLVLTEYFLRINLALSCFVLPFLGIPLGIRLKKEDKITGISVSIIVAVTFYAIFVLGITLGEKTNVAPAVTVSLPNIAGIIYGMIMNINLLRK